MNTPVADRTITAEYAALTRGTALQDRPNAGSIVLTDADRADFLHRMTTNDINALLAGEVAVTVLTSPTARNLFVFTVVNRGDDLLLLPAPNRSTALIHHLRGHIFFMDAVTVTDAGGQFRRMRLMGPGAGEKLVHLGFPAVSSSEESAREYNGIIAVSQTRYDLPGIELLIPLHKGAAVREQLVETGALLLSEENAYTARRIELGRPVPGRELTEEYSPLESGLAWACSETKGCYTGQEIIARQITYDKVTRTLVGLVADGLLTAGATVTCEGKPVGTITSAGVSPALGRPVALAIVKRPQNLSGTVVEVGKADDVSITAEISDLPLVA